MPQTRSGRAGAAAFGAICGFVLPLSFVSRIDSFALYATPGEQLAIYGTAWLQHVPIAGATALVLVGLVKAFPRILDGRRAATAVLIGGFVLAALLGLRPLLPFALPQLAVVGLALCTAAAAASWKPDLGHTALPVAIAFSLIGMPLGAWALLQGMRLNEPLAASAGLPAAGEARPDILIVTMDAFANGHMSAEGYPRPTTPRLDAFAAKGTRFSRLVSSSNFTTPAVNSLLSGQRPWRHGANQQGAHPVEQARIGSMPARFHAAGYRLLSVATNPWAGIYKNGYGRWFEPIESDQLGSLSACRNDISRWLPRSCAAADVGLVRPLSILLENAVERSGLRPQGSHNRAGPALERAERLFQRDSSGRPVFMWVHVLPPHDPYIAPPPWLGRINPSPLMRRTMDAMPPYGLQPGIPDEDVALFKARYDEMLMAVDFEVGEFLDRLEAQGRLRNTIVIVSADHGESFKPHYMGHGGPGLHPGLTNIPLILRGPGIPAGRIIPEPVEQVDIAPTLLAMVGLVPEAGHMDGRSLLPLLQGGTLPAVPLFTMNLERASRFSPPRSGSVAVLMDGLKFTHHWGTEAGAAGLPDSLCDTTTDWNEQHNLLGERQNDAARLKAVLLAERSRQMAR